MTYLDCDPFTGICFPSIILFIRRTLRSFSQWNETHPEVCKRRRKILCVYHYYHLHSSWSIRQGSVYSYAVEGGDWRLPRHRENKKIKERTSHGERQSMRQWVANKSNTTTHCRCPGEVKLVLYITSIPQARSLRSFYILAFVLLWVVVVVVVHVQSQLVTIL